VEATRRWWFPSPAGAGKGGSGLYTQGAHASGSLTTCAQQGIATLNQLASAETIRCQ